MYARYVLAFVGASGITLGMLYGMNEIVEIFQRRDATQYFPITDVRVLPGDSRPRPIPRAGRQPERGDIEFDRPDVSLDVEQPSVQLEGASDAPRIRPRLEAPPSAED